MILGAIRFLFLTIFIYIVRWIVQLLLGHVFRKLQKQAKAEQKEAEKVAQGRQMIECKKCGLYFDEATKPTCVEEGCPYL